MDIKKATDQELVNELQKRNDFPILNMLYLELSHVACAKTEKELRMENGIKDLEKQVEDLGPQTGAG